MLAAAALLAGCAAGVPEPVLRADPPPDWRNAPAEAAALAAAPDPGAWWTVYGDSLLDRLVDQALAGNLDVAEARARLLAARRLHGASRAPYRPELSFRTRDAVAADASSSYFQAGFDAVWELGLFGRAEGAARLAQADLDAAGATLQAARVSVAAEVVRAYRQLQHAQERAELLRQAVALQERRAELLKARQRARLGSQLDLDKARAELEQARAALAEPGLEARRSAQQLALLLGRNEPDPAWLAGRAAPRPAPPALALRSAPADLLRTRPDVRLAEARVLEAAGALGIARADLYPRLGLGGSITIASNFMRNVDRRREPTNTQTIFSLGPLIDIPLFDWGRRQAARQARDHELDAALIAYRQAVLTGVAETETALIELDQYRQRRAAEQQALAALERAAAQARRLTQLRLSSDFENTELAARRVQAELALSATGLAQDLAFISLHKAVGGAPPWRDEAPAESGG